MKSNREALRWIALLGLIIIQGEALEAKDCTVSKEFHIQNAQVLTGVLQDVNDATLPAIKLELVSGTKIVHDLRTNDQGAYNFGEVPAGKYRIHVRSTGDAFCAPQIQCGAQGCSLQPRLALNPKKLHPITVH
jgi:hypothetical protein